MSAASSSSDSVNVRYVAPSMRAKTEEKNLSSYESLNKVLHLTTQSMSDDRVDALVRELISRAREIIIANYNPKFDGPLTYFVTVVKRGVRGRDMLRPLGFSYVWIDDPDIFNVLAGPMSQRDEFNTKINRKIVKKVYGTLAERKSKPSGQLSWADLMDEFEDEESGVVPDTSTVLLSSETVDIDPNFLGVVEAELNAPERILYRRLIENDELDPNRLGRVSEEGIFLVKPKAAPIKPDDKPEIDEARMITRGPLPEWYNQDDLAVAMARFSIAPVRTQRDVNGNFVSVPVQITPCTNGRMIVDYKEGTNNGTLALKMVRLFHISKVVDGVLHQDTLVFEPGNRRPDIVDRTCPRPPYGVSPTRPSSPRTQSTERPPSRGRGRASPTPRPSSPGTTSPSRPPSRGQAPMNGGRGRGSPADRPTSPLSATPSAAPTSKPPVQLRPPSTPAWGSSKPGSIYGK